eukprot:1642659-Prorocentrum_lima.AAC.1
MWIRRDGATRRPAPFAVKTVDCSIDPEEDFEEQPLMAHTGQVDSITQVKPDELLREGSRRQEAKMK